ncbi:MAG TPA: hypothetical protein VFK69_13210, partial [Candidatus Eisenbacteria bacterium]|nr:hypothetical protein [Candidatus Eisenbacteria bacterium]
VQRDHRFVPRVLPVVAGDTVVFRNADGVWHNAFSISPARAFDLGPFGPGAMRRVRFDHPGVVQVYSGMDPEMAGYIVVLPGQRFARPDRAGAFQFADLAPGRYDVHAWHPDLGERSACVTVTPKGSAVLRITY